MVHRGRSQQRLDQRSELAPRWRMTALAGRPCCLGARTPTDHPQRISTIRGSGMASRGVRGRRRGQAPCNHVGVRQQARKTVLFGGKYAIGSSTTYSNDTWEWDGSAWTQVATSGPTARTVRRWRMISDAGAHCCSWHGFQRFVRDILQRHVEIRNRLHLHTG